MNIQEELERRHTFVVQLQQYLKSQAPLEERWATYINSEELLPLGDELLCVLESNILGLSLYDHFGTDRYETLTFTKGDDIVKDVKQEYDIYTPCLYTPEKVLIPGITREDFKEAILASGCRGCIYDW